MDDHEKDEPAAPVEVAGSERQGNQSRQGLAAGAYKSCIGDFVPPRKPWPPEKRETSMISAAILQIMVDSGMSAQQIVDAVVIDQQEDFAKLQRTRERAAERQRLCRERHRLSQPVTVTIENTEEFPNFLPSMAINTIEKKDKDSKKEKKERKKKERISTEQVSGQAVPKPPDRFPDFWAAYPKRDGSNPPTPAKKKFVAAIKSGVDPEVIIAGARRYAAQLAAKNAVGSPYVAQAVTWLHQRRWEEYEATNLPSSTGQANEPIGWRPGLPTHEELLKRYSNGKSEQSNGASVHRDGRNFYQNLA